MAANQTFTVECIHRIWDDTHGSYFEVSEDSDGLYLIELRGHHEDSKIYARLTMPLEAAELIAKALLAKAGELRGRRIFSDQNRD